MERFSVEEIKDIVSRIAAEYGAERVYLFGSFARGDMNANSDIDLRIDKGAIRGFQLGGFLMDLQDAIGIPVDIVSTGSLDPEFLEAIAKDEVLLYEAS